MNRLNSLVWIISIIITMTYSVRSQVPYATTPFWISSYNPDYSTGCAWADINRDGWQDLVVANGNDMARQTLAVYLNNQGVLPSTASWQSSDIDYHGHLSVGDINRDGYPDVAVSVYLGAGGFDYPGKVKVYMNHSGTLSSLPDWESADSLYAFSCALGDADGDGDLDLAATAGESYYSHPEPFRIYYNHDGILDTLPGWKSGFSGYALDVDWADIDNDGKLDLLFAGNGSRNYMFKNFGDSIGTMPYWISKDPSVNANSLFTGDIDNDGDLDLAISDNNQLGGSGRFKIYRNLSGNLDTIPFWSSDFSGYGSGINLNDVNRDSLPDLVTGGWWEPCRIYLNQGGTFPSLPDWTSSTGSVVEAITFSDFDHDGMISRSTVFYGNGTRSLFYLPYPPLQAEPVVFLNQDTLDDSSYCYNLENGWISLSFTPDAGDTVFVNYLVSNDNDFAVSNWDNNKGNYLFKNTHTPVSVNETAIRNTSFVLNQNYPNPFNPSTTIHYSIKETGLVKLKIYNMLGQEVRTLVNARQNAGSHHIVWDGKDNTGVEASSGVYIYRIQTGNYVKSHKMIFAK